MKISLNEKIFVAGANGMVGSAVKRLLSKKGYGLKSNNGIIFAPDKTKLNLANYIEVKNWFEYDIESPYMNFAIPFKDNMKDKVPAVVHFDGTARLQIAKEGQLLFEILNELEKMDIEIIANSSLNLSGDPTCFDLIDALMIAARNPLKYIITDFALLEAIK